MEWYHVWWSWMTSKRVARFVSDSWVSCLHYHQEFAKCSPLALTHAVRMVTPLLNCTCIMDWSGAAHSVNSRKSAYCIGNVSLDRMPNVTAMIHTSLREGRLPSSYKHAVVTPLLRKRQRSLLTHQSSNATLFKYFTRR